jgi:D-alanyl-D-alanine carboxypeptidase
MTSIIVGILFDKGMLDIDQAICHYLPDDVTESLFVYKSVDYKVQVTIRQLLSHTSGVADYFESKTNAGSMFVDQIMDNPDKIWSPIELIDFTRNNQNAKSAPGKFLYSDTGYVLLGLIIEKVLKMPFHEVLSEYIFKPLSMKDSYLLFGGKPINPKRNIAPVWFNAKEISKLNMLSCDWAGGGVISTLSDLLIFQKAIWSGKLVSKKYLSEMTKINNKFRSGMYYGSGMMELRFEGFFFLLRGLPRPVGHSGILGTLMFYDETNDLHTIINLGSNKRVVDSFKSIIYIEQSSSRFIKTN